LGPCRITAVQRLTILLNISYCDLLSSVEDEETGQAEARQTGVVKIEYGYEGYNTST